MKNDVRLLWLLAACVLAGGLFGVQSRYQSRIAASQRRIESLYRETVADERTVRQAAALRAVEERVRADLGRLSRGGSLSGATADLLRMLHGSARRFRTRVLSLDPGVPEPSAGGLQPTALTIRARGRFRDILAFVEDLSHHSTLINVSATEIALAHDGDASGGPPLEATVHATLYRLTEPGPEENGAAAAR